MIRSCCILLTFISSPVQSGTVTPTLPIRAGTIIESIHLDFLEQDVPGALKNIEDVIGLEARTNLYPNQPIRKQDLTTPTVIRRNSRIQIVYRSSGLEITVEGRALSRASVGELVQVMNTSSRNSVQGIAVGFDRVEVAQ